jgi:hypothetical protein
MSVDSVFIEYNLVYQASATFAQPLTPMLKWMPSVRDAVRLYDPLLLC